MPDLRSKMLELRSERFEKLVLGLRGLILDLIQSWRPDYGLGRPDLGLLGLVSGLEGLILGLGSGMARLDLRGLSKVLNGLN